LVLLLLLFLLVDSRRRRRGGSRSLLEGYVMFRSLSRITVAAALVLALALSAVPAQALPRNLGAVDLDASWLDAALAWLQGWLGGDPEPLHRMEAKKNNPTIKTGPCIDPYGCPDIAEP
jgi:hypothetical protein